MFSAVFVFQVFRLFKVVRKIQINYIKNQRDGTFQKNQKMEGGPPPGTQEGAWRGPALGHARGPPGFPVGPLGSPLRLYLRPGVETPNTEPFFAKPSLFRRRRRFKIGDAWRSCSGTLPEGDSPSGRPSIAMDASRMCREYSPLDQGSVISSYVMNFS